MELLSFNQSHPFAAIFPTIVYESNQGKMKIEIFLGFMDVG
jgi:hypothetical protein